MGWLEDLAGAASTAVAAIGTGVESVAEGIANGAEDLANGVEQLGGAAAQGLRDAGFGLAGDMVGTGTAAVGLGLSLFGIGVGAIGRTAGAACRGEWDRIGEIWHEAGEQAQQEFDDFTEQSGNYTLSLDESSNGNPRGCTGVPRSTASAWSFAAQQSPDRPVQYRDTGVRYAFRLVDGRVEFTRYDDFRTARDWQPLTPPNETEACAIDWETSREPHKQVPPRFDMIAASGDRVFAKQEGADRYYFLMMDEMFEGSGKRAVAEESGVRCRCEKCGVSCGGKPNAPLVYFKLDPTPNKAGPPPPGGDGTSLLVRDVPEDGLRDHPRSERINLFRRLVALGLSDMMMVRARPRVWHLMDARPPFKQDHVPDDLPTYRSSVHRAQTSIGGRLYPPCIQHAIAVEHVLGIGVGNMHFYEQWERGAGGEIQSMLARHAWEVPVFALFYTLFNGPLHDADGWIDGTCNFYVLARLEPSGGRQRYAILFIDEQSYFSQRWRLLHPRDYRPTGIDPLHKTLNFSLAASLAPVERGNRFEPSEMADITRYRPECFWDPFEHGSINDDSRLAVARQVLCVSGADPHTGRQELYTINFSWGSMDRSWRWRTWPDTGSTARPSATTAAKNATGTVDPQTIGLRGDLTLHVAGFGPGVGGNAVSGRWYQSYLPCDAGHVPVAEELAGGKPATGYTHPWQFLPEATWLRADGFSHFGVYESVDSRCQFYELELAPDVAEEIGNDELACWSEVLPEGNREAPERLSVRGWKLDWRGLAQELDDRRLLQRLLTEELPRLIRRDTRITELRQYLEKYFIRWDHLPADGTLEDQHRTSTTSMFHPAARWRLLRRGRLGWIAVWHDKRDDDLLSIANLPRLARFRARPDGPILELAVVRNVRHPARPAVAAALVAVRPAGGCLTIEYRTPLSAHDADIHLWQCTLGALAPDDRSWRDHTVLCRFDCHSDFVRTDEQGVGVYRGEFSFDDLRRRLPRDVDWGGNEQVADFFSRLCCPRGRASCGTSLWFHDVVGHVAAPDRTDFVEPQSDEGTQSRQPLPEDR